MSLEDVEAPTGLNEEEEKQLHVSWVVTEYILQQLHFAGFGFPRTPEIQIPHVSADKLSNVDIVQCSQWFSAVEQWQSYCSALMSFFASKKLECVNEKTHLEASIRKRLRKMKTKENLINDLVTTTPRIVELMQLEQAYKIYESSLEPHYESIKTTYKMVSRALTLRQQEIDLAAGKGQRRYGQGFS